MASLVHPADSSRPLGGLSSVAWTCVVVFTAAFVLAAVEPRYPQAFRLEVLPVLAAMPFFGWMFGLRLLSDRAWVQITAFLVLHLYGAHSTYANTPIGFALQGLLEASRNHYDRVVHFAFGALMVRPLCELLPQPTRARGLLVAFAFVGAMSVGYEQLEWITATLSDPNAGAAFLGAQGDAWDAQKDVTCATAGSLLAIALEWVLTRPAAPRRTPSGRAGRSSRASAT